MKPSLARSGGAQLRAPSPPTHQPARPPAANPPPRREKGAVGDALDRQQQLLCGAAGGIRVRGGHPLQRVLLRHLLAQEAAPDAWCGSLGGGWAGGRAAARVMRCCAPRYQHPVCLPACPCARRLDIQQRADQPRRGPAHRLCLPRVRASATPPASTRGLPDCVRGAWCQRCWRPRTHARTHARTPAHTRAQPPPPPPMHTLAALLLLARRPWSWSASSAATRCPLRLWA